MKKRHDIAVIFKKEYYLGRMEFTPVKVISGSYDSEGKCFVDKDGTTYYHIIENPDNYGFGYFDEIYNYKKQHPLLNETLIKLTLLHTLKKCFFAFRYNDDYIPIVEVTEKNGKTFNLIDNNILNYYREYHPDFFDKHFEVRENGDIYLKSETETDVIEENKEEKKEEKVLKVVEDKKQSIDVSTLFKEITDTVIEDFSDKKSRNILINGSTGVGKTETFRILSKLLNVPCVIVSATEYTAAGYVGKSVDDMLVSLIKKANGDVKRAQEGILIIDEIDKLSESNSGHSQINQRDVQEALLKLLEDGVFSIKSGFSEVEFDTSRLMVVGMGSWSRIDLTPKRSVGFNSVEVKKTYKDITREDIVSNGLIPELVGRFSTLVQMNELNFDSFVRILKSKNNVINQNKKFFSGKGIDLVFDDKAIDAVAKEADKNNYGARGLDEIIERALSAASFEIASDPEKYSSLIITEETIEDPKKYVLTRKENNNS